MNWQKRNIILYIGIVLIATLAYWLGTTTASRTTNSEQEKAPVAKAIEQEQNSEQMSELKQEAEEWIKNPRSFETKQGQYYSFRSTDESPCTDCGAYAAWWQATSKVRIGDCPAGSIWEMRYGADEGGTSGRNIVPPECKSITPKPITDFDYVSINHEYAD